MRHIADTMTREQMVKYLCTISLTEDRLNTLDNNLLASAVNYKGNI